VNREIRTGALLVALWASAAPAGAMSGEAVSVPVRGKMLTLTVYQAREGAPVRGTIFMGSGDVGWVGLAVTLAEFLSDEGYVVAGINVRQYLSSFTTATDHLTVAQIPPDYSTLADVMRRRNLLPRPVVLSGVSEGAALAVAAAAMSNHEWAHGVLTLGLPPSAELAWRWTDFTSWITKRNTNEPSFEPDDVIGQVSPLPIWMIQSRRDEYVKEEDYRRFEAAARPPKKLVLIDASNHRFTDRLPELKQQVLAGLAWIAASRQAP
jgi:type IV secretory pathway VirJ component